MTNKFEIEFNRKMKEERKINLEQTPGTLPLLQKKGGNWLGCVRNWIQRKAFNGETVTWGSQDFLKLKELTVSDIELLAADIAASALNEQAKSIQQNGVKGFEKIEPEEYYALLDAKAELERTKRMLTLYQEAVNRIDDYFEYLNESQRDKKQVRDALGFLTAKLKELQHVQL